MRRLGGALLLALPLLEILGIVLVGKAIGGWLTFGLLIAGGVLGAIIIKREGVRSWRSLNTAAQTGTMPARRMADSGLVLIGGLLLLLPGFISDVFGLLLLLPLTRSVGRVAMAYLVTSKVAAVHIQTQTWERPGRSDDQPGAGTTVRGEIID